MNIGIADFLMIVRQVFEINLGMLTLAYFNFSLVITVVILISLWGCSKLVFKILSKKSLEYTHANERLVNTINDILNGLNSIFLTQSGRNL